MGKKTKKAPDAGAIFKEENGFVPDSRFGPLGRDALWITGGWCVLFAITMTVAYIFGSGDPKEYTYVCGFPLWFALCTLIQLAAMGITIYMLARKFCNVSLDADDPEYDYGEDE